MPKFGRFLAEMKVGWVRISAYLGILNFIMILGIWLDRHYPAYVVPAYVLTFVLALVGIWIDRRLIWPNEAGISESVSVLKITECIRSAKHIVESELIGVDTRPQLRDLRAAFARTGLLESFEFHLAHYRKEMKPSAKVNGLLVKPALKKR